MPWTPENIQRIRSLAEGGFSASQIAAQIGGVTRNSVVGVGARNGIKFHGASGGYMGGRRTVQEKQENSNEPAPAPSRREIGGSVLREAPVSEKDFKPLMLTLVELDHGDCRWPEGDQDFRFCGHPALLTMPYCKFHSRMAYRLPEHR
jgi:GcrA cell cycle regulator